MRYAPLPDCFDCKYGGGRFPCRTKDGLFDFAKVGRAIVERGRRHDEDEHATEAGEEIDWVTDCEYELVQDHPQLILALMLAAMDACETPEDAAYLAAGLVETSIVKHGPLLIDRVEVLASRSPKFRYILSGIWSQGGSVDKDVWARIGKAIGAAPRMSDDGRGPWDGSPVTVLGEDEATLLMAERVAAAAHGLGI